MRWLFLFLGACTFNAPQLPGAREACLAYVEALDARLGECGDTEVHREAQTAANRAKCDRTVYATEDVYKVCIPALKAVDCKELTGAPEKCDALQGLP